MLNRLWLRGGLVALMSGFLLLLAAGCNEGTDFDPNDLFSIEDYATDQDYALVFISGMNQWRESMQTAKGWLDTNVEGLSFIESVPPGWSQVDPENTSYPWAIEGGPEVQPFDENWYFSSFQDAGYELAAFNQGVPDGTTLDPARVEYLRLRYTITPFGDKIGFGNGVELAYTDNFQNPSMLNGNGFFANSFLVTAQEAPSDVAAYASMVNQWNAQMTNVSPTLGNPQGEYVLTGVTDLVRADLVEQAQLSVEGHASIRSNAKGDATVFVEGEERARITFTFFDTSFHGYYTLASSNFEETIAF